MIGFLATDGPDRAIIVAGVFPVNANLV